ncbi:MAG: response regulator [Candidatus Omnitrophota bacterium]|jgi:DNA-binding response OmpR family regulator
MEKKLLHKKPPQRKSLTPRKKSAKKKVMIVDDDNELRKEVNTLIMLQGYKTFVFSSGIKALKMVQRIKPDIILLDIKMEGMDGFEVVEELRHFPDVSAIPVIFMSAFYTGKEHSILMNFFGVKARLVKPFNPLELLEKIDLVLKDRESLKQNSINN